VAEQKRAANLNLAKKWLGELPGATILKTDLFEEANSGVDAIFSNSTLDHFSSEED
jgi:hypothetical protein